MNDNKFTRLIGWDGTHYHHKDGKGKRKGKRMKIKERQSRNYG
jgi:hypothetical protein